MEHLENYAKGCVREALNKLYPIADQDKEGRISQAIDSLEQWQAEQFNPIAEAVIRNQMDLLKILPTGLFEIQPYGQSQWLVKLKK